RPAVLVEKDGVFTFSVCDECDSALRRDQVPRFALVNDLFRDVLPDEFSDLTWAEEMVCAIYRTTAHVARLYSTSSKPSDPLV
ncbi:hypothetical protein M407DRAFT_232307, partial [Tulasnella calospora MUT 4182]